MPGRTRQFGNGATGELTTETVEHAWGEGAPECPEVVLRRALRAADDAHRRAYRSAAGRYRRVMRPAEATYAREVRAAWRRFHAVQRADPRAAWVDLQSSLRLADRAVHAHRQRAGVQEECWRVAADQTRDQAYAEALATQK